MRRVAIVCGAFQPMLDGVVDYTSRLVAQLAAAGVEAPVISTDDGQDVPGVELHGVARHWNLPGGGACGRTARPDLVHVQFAPSAYGYSPAIGLLPLFLGPIPPLGHDAARVQLVVVAPQGDLRDRLAAPVVGR